MPGSVGWKWKADAYRHATGSSMSKSSLREAFAEWCHPPPRNSVECDKSRCDRFSVAISLPVIRDQMPVVHDICAQLRQRLDQSSILGIGLAERRNRGLQLIELAQRFVDLAMPQ